MRARILFWIFCGGTAAAWSQTASEAGPGAMNLAVRQLAYPMAQTSMAWRLNSNVSNFSAASHVSLFDETEATTSGQRSVLKAAVFSAVIPGAGQVYNHSYWSALLFVGIEVGGLYTNFKYNNEGDDLTAVFQQYADTHWSEPEYWRSVSEDALRLHGLVIDPNDIASLREYERQYFSHFLPPTKNQTYYENIGKYDQFNGGWDDGSGNAHERGSANREAYTYMRKDANDKYKTATTGVTVVIINHMVSALHAAFITHNHNRALAQSAVGVKMKRYGSDWIPEVNLKLAW